MTDHARVFVLVWLLLGVGIWVRAPRIPTLLKDDATGFLPAECSSQQAWARLKAEFPDSSPKSRCAIVFARDAGLAAGDEDYVGEFSQSLAARSEEFGWRVRSAALTPYLHSILTSPDGAATVVAVDLPGEMLTHHSVGRVREIKKELGDRPAPAGLQVEVTGGAAMGELLDANAKHDVDRTTLWAFGAVAVILLFIYRSPIAMLLPLVTIALALMVSLGAVGWAASWGWPINGLVEMFIVVLIAGAGVDYCLFLFARFREELPGARGDATEATRRAMEHAGPAILASAATVAAGLVTLLLARNRDLHTSGVAIAFAVAVAALAVLSLTPAIMRIAGLRLVRFRGETAGSAARSVVSDGLLWRWAAHWVTARPGLVAFSVVALLAVPSVLAFHVPTLYDTYDEFPSDSSFIRGARLYDRHFFDSRGTSEMTLVVSADAPLTPPALRSALRGTLTTVAETLRREFPVAYVRDLTSPLGAPREGSSSALTQLLQTRVGGGLVEAAYLGRSGSAMRIDLGIFVEPRSVEAMALVERVREAVSRVLQSSDSAGSGLGGVRVDVAGEAAVYADMRNLRRRDFGVVAVAASGLIYVILLALLRAPLQSLILLAATLVTYLATYGASAVIVHAAFGLNGLSWQIHFLLFVIIMSLGQDYNIFVVARIHEELRTRPPREAIGVAIRRTGKVVSSCGIIMAATFASMFSGSLLVLQEFAIALPLGILIDTFLVRPLLVPAAILLLVERAPRKRAFLAA